MSLLKFDVWLSKKLKKKTYFLAEKNIKKFFKKKITFKNKFIYTKIKRKKLSKLLIKNSFRFITTNTQCKKKFLRINKLNPNCFLAKKSDLKDIADIAKKSYKYSRFHLDKKIPNKTCNKIFFTWVKNYFKKQRGDYLLVYKQNKKTIGFLLLKKEDKSFLRIDLIAVKNKFKGLNIGKKLIEYAMFLYQKKYSHLVVGYQSHNFSAKIFYKKTGFTILSKRDIYHYY